MRVVQLQADNFKRLKAVQITPAGDVVTIGGKNGQGKSSVLDAIYVALVGRSAAPPQPIRKGEEQCRIRLDLGDLIVTRTFTQKEGDRYTNTLKVETSEGLRHATRPQDVLDALLGEIGFDPFAFVQMKPDKQAETLLGMVPLTVDLEEFAELDASDFAKRRDTNRDVKGLEAQISAIPAEALPGDLPDRNALVAALGAAADTNSGINAEKQRRERRLEDAVNARSGAEQQEGSAQRMRDEAARLIAQAEDLEGLAKGHRERADATEKEVAALPEVDPYVDTEALREQIRAADEAQRRADRQAQRAELVARRDALAADADALTKAMDDREAKRTAALAKAKMPIDGLSFHVPETGKPRVLFGGVPFEQASTAEQLRASTAIAMAANPTLRVLRVKDGALLDEDSMALLTKLAADEEFQLWVEVVGTGEGVGIVMEDGSVKDAAPEPEAKPKAKAKDKAAPAPEPGKLV